MINQKRKIRLYGRLRKLFGPEFELAVETAGEAFRALNCLFPGKFHNAIREGSYYIVRGDDRRNGLSLDVADLNTFRLGGAPLHIVPAVQGSARNNKGGGALKAVLGVVLIATAIFTGGATLGMSAQIMGGALGGLTYGNLALLGVSLALSGVATMLTPTEKPKQETTRDDSFTLSGPGNAVAQGSPVPLVYGRIITGSALASAGIDIEELGPSPNGDKWKNMMGRMA